jgi:hypothetical protein
MTKQELAKNFEDLSIRFEKHGTTKSKDVYASGCRNYANHKADIMAAAGWLAFMRVIADRFAPIGESK